MNTDYSTIIAQKLNMRPQQVAAAIALLDEGNTLPFIARYRKERTEGLDEEQLRVVVEQLESLRALDERRQAIIESIREQGLLTPPLAAQLAAATTRTALEDLYQPYKPKRRTRASIAREKGLQPLAELILAQQPTRQTLEQLVAPFVNDAVPHVEEALAGARDIVAETISDHPGVRGLLREKALQWATLSCDKIDGAADERGVFRTYYEFAGQVGRLRPHQTLAINRGEAEKVLRVRLSVPERDWRNAITSIFRVDRRSPLAEQLALAIDDAAERLLLPAIERDVRRTLTKHAEQHAIQVFAANLRGLLLQPPLSNQTVLGLDPGFRTGCKVAVVEPTGRLLETATIYPHEPQRRKNEALHVLAELVARHKVTLIAIGNGTASRETEQLVAELIQGSRVEGQRSGSHPARHVADTQSDATNNLQSACNLQYVMVSEAGASVYSASPLARAELPELDVSLRGAVSIARRVQDPLAELVKIDPQAIGVGMYQHDVDGARLTESLGGVVESVVNAVGVDANTASAALLTHVAGIGPKLAEKIVAHRNTNGPFPNRKALRKVAGLGPKAFEQAAGFLRVRGGDEPLDASAIHPESYPVATRLLHKVGLHPHTPPPARAATLTPLRDEKRMEALATELGAGTPTLCDIVEQLLRPGRDPREDLPAPILRSDVLSLDDLQTGLVLKGTVRNVVDFGAFVDIGVKQDGLLHRTQLPRGTTLTVGDVIDVEIVAVERERGRISLGWPSCDRVTG